MYVLVLNMLQRFCVNRITHGTNVTFEFEFGDGTSLDNVEEHQLLTVSVTHVYRDGQHQFLSFFSSI